MTAQREVPRSVGWRDLLSATYDVSDFTLACYSAAGFSADLRAGAGPGLRLVSLTDLYEP
jgi:hypothetical protein